MNTRYERILGFPPRIPFYCPFLVQTLKSLNMSFPKLTTKAGAASEDLETFT